MAAEQNATGGPQLAAAIADIPEAAPGDRTQRLDRSLVTGIAWTGGIRWASQLLSWISTLVVARLLSPGDYGIAGIALTYIGFVQLVSEFGIGTAVVQQRHLTRDQISQLGGVALGLGLVFAVISAALALPVASFFAEPALTAVIIVMSTSFVLVALQVLPRALLTRDLKFTTLGWFEGAEALVLTGTTITLAFLGLGYWALVLGVLSSRVVGTIVILAFYPSRLAWPRRLTGLATPLQLGAHVLAANVLWYAFASADLALIGRILGSAALGAYMLAATIAAVPVDRFTTLISRLTPAIFAAVQDDVAALRRYLLRLTEGTAIISVPLSVGLALVAHEFVYGVLGAKWGSMVVPLRLLALSSVARSLVPLMAQVLIATGQARRNTQTTVALVLIMPPLFLLGTRWGAVGVAWVWVLAYPVIVAASALRFALAASATTVGQYLRSLWPATSACIVMAAAVLGTGFILPDEWTPLAVLAVKVIVGAVVYIVTLSLLHSSRVAGFLRLLRLVRRSPAAAGTTASSASA